MKASVCFIACLLVVQTGCSNLRPDIADVGKSGREASFAAQYRLLESRIDQFNGKWQRLEKKQWYFSEGLAISGGATAVAVAAHATPYAIGAAAIAGLTSVTEQFYGLDKQNAAWTKAAYTFQCMQAFSSPLASAPSNVLSQIKSPDYPNSEDAEKFALRTLGDAMQKVDRTLQERLRIKAVNSEPNWSAFSTAVNNAAKSSKAVLADSALAADVKLEALLVSIGRYKSDLDACIAAN